LEQRQPAGDGHVLRGDIRRRLEGEIANADEGSFRIAAAPSFDPDKLTVAELEQLLALTEKANVDDGAE